MYRLESEEDLEESLSRPSEADIELMERLDGKIMILGAGGKMGPSLARRVARAATAAGEIRGPRVTAVSRFGLAQERVALEEAGVETIACDLLDRNDVDRLPDCDNILFLAGRKFGSSDRPELTWASNAILPTYVASRYSRARIVVFSTGNVYPFTRTNAAGQYRGSVESDSPDPRGEYAQSCLGRERVFEYFSAEYGTRVLLFRLNYATDLRYGILPEIAGRVFRSEPVDLNVGYFNTIWQGDANSYAMRALDLCESPARRLNVTGPGIVSVREAALWFGEKFRRPVIFEGRESGIALLSEARECHRLLGMPEIVLESLMEMTASWIEHGGRSLAKPTRFEVTDGKF